MNQPRSSGLLLHVSSLPSTHGIGDLGPSAYRFADFLHDTGQQIWQVLPVGPVGFGYSPYSSPSTFAGNPLFISPLLLVDDGLLEPADVQGGPAFPEDRVDFERVIPYRRALLRKAYCRLPDAPPHHRERFETFCERNSYWLDDYALFMAVKESFDEAAWTCWPRKLAARRPEALARFQTEQADSVRLHKFMQFLFDDQWFRLKRYCNERSIRIFGDLPIYVAHDSADVWAHPDLFHLEDDGRPSVVSGVPPDYFSETGQRWGNPLYRWSEMRKRGYAWWTRRFQKALSLLDLVRLDHFRGFAGYWEIDASEDTAVNGRWVEGPGATLFRTLQERLGGSLPVVAEDLGIITPDVTALMEQFGFPGMAVLQFAFDDGADHIFLPHNYKPSVVAYSGTHDNDTLVGWWNTACDDGRSRARSYAAEYLQVDEGRAATVHWAAIQALMASVARVVIIPMQDVLGLGSEARMNVPGLDSGNWSWRFRQDTLTNEVAGRLKSLTAVYGRSPQAYPE